MRFVGLRLLLAAAIAALPVPALAQAYQCRVPARVTVPTVRPDGPVRKVPITGFTLALSWSPEFCKLRGRQGDMQCDGRNGHFGLIVHGLWPEGRGTWPQWCPTPRRLSPAEARRNLCMMPSTRLQANEWAKHGACMVPAPESYFRITRILFEGLRLPDLDRLSKEPDLTAGMLRNRFAAANPGWPADAVGIRLNARGWLQELRLCYDRRYMPARCDRRRLGPADGTQVRIWRGL
ncbi:ribonuclease T [Altererythrobacter aerius]|uniref:Ribonuclease T n=2 Tax=Tsuneonella aeria TaxID=1837929 RepID=A0A6I4TFH9_9SPHN|nr:ribonuclease T [Tsuneonella aeria]MXO75366.1 ribonuclease T [Tsuneonella aeria]